MTIAPAAYTHRVELHPAHLRRSLADAPIGAHPLVEAALAWQRLRPPVLAPPLSQRGYEPLVATDDEEVAIRAARVLSELAFCVVNQPDRNLARWHVDVPASRYRPVTRALSLVWRDLSRQYGPAATVAARDPEAAIALWRMASLLADGGPNPHLLTVSAGTSATAVLLVAAANRLGVRSTMQRIKRLPAVVVDEPDQLRHLFATLLRPRPT
jgi:hypothetical protein